MTGASAEAIKHHYDASNEFYSLWLDPTLTYSAAFFDEGYSLEEAQIRKLDYHLNQARVRGAKRVLDVGCGWGGLMERMTGSFGVAQAVGLTLSASQAEHIRTRGWKSIEVLEESWEEHQVEQSYDGIISIGAFEHFASPSMTDDQQIGAYRAFFDFCARVLNDGGYLSLQTIAYGRSTRKDINQFILDQIFPESDLPTLASIVAAFEGKFELVQMRNDRDHYTKTFQCWSQRLHHSRSQAVDTVGEEKVRFYEKYHGLFTLGFHSGAMDLLRITLKRVDR